MICEGDPFVIEYNVRGGDPETQALLFRLESDLLPVLCASAEGRLEAGVEKEVRFGDPAVCVVLASGGYPRSYDTGIPIEGLEAVESMADVKVFHSGTHLEGGEWRTAGGRVLGVTARGATLSAARARAYEAAAQIRFRGRHYRTDIACRGRTA